MSPGVREPMDYLVAVGGGASRVAAFNAVSEASR